MVSAIPDLIKKISIGVSIGYWNVTSTVTITVRVSSVLGAKVLVGTILGLLEGTGDVGTSDGKTVGIIDGDDDGKIVGVELGNAVGRDVGTADGCVGMGLGTGEVGTEVGTLEGTNDGFRV